MQDSSTLTHNTGSVRFGNWAAWVLLTLKWSDKITEKINVDSSKNLLKTSTQIARNCWVLAVFNSVAVFPVTAVIANQSVLAQPIISEGVWNRDALLLYGNAVNSGLCKSLSPTTQNLWVCELTSSEPDIHLTFNASTNLPITVRSLAGTPTQCEGRSDLLLRAGYG